MNMGCRIGFMQRIIKPACMAVVIAISSAAIRMFSKIGFTPA
jgi:hypothetical protein